jgi:hypothetical protein
MAELLLKNSTQVIDEDFLDRQDDTIDDEDLYCAECSQEIIYGEQTVCYNCAKVLCGLCADEHEDNCELNEDIE